MSYGDFRTCLEDWEDLEKEFTHLEVCMVSSHSGFFAPLQEGLLSI